MKSLTRAPFDISIERRRIVALFRSMSLPHSRIFRTGWIYANIFPGLIHLSAAGILESGHAPPTQADSMRDGG